MKFWTRSKNIEKSQLITDEETQYTTAPTDETTTATLTPEISVNSVSSVVVPDAAKRKRREEFKSRMKKRALITLAVVLIVIDVIAVLLFKFGDKVVDALSKFANAVIDLGPRGIVIIVLLFLLFSFPPLFGQVSLAYVVGFVYGVWKGFLIVYPSTIAGACLAFFVSRKFLRGYYLRKCKDWELFDALERVVEKNGLKIAIMTRLAPYPFGLTIVVFGLSPIVDFRIAGSI
ncbi:Tlg2-vesicle protein [Nowakowskiella sp. JEL0407]|nr:Tlg2-vesicle protein [Nowakowskiella sp. JEL0407]